MTDSDVFRIAFASLRGLTLPSATQLLERCGSEENFFAMSERELCAISGFKNRMFSAEFREKLLERMRREAEFADAHGIHAVTFADDAYPQRMLDCDDAPLMIYTLGRCDLNAMHMIGIVGTRHATAYGVDFVNRFVADIAELSPEPVVIVSGLAYGIDIAAHHAAMKEGLPTVAVLAHGLNTIYPAAHRQAAVNIISRGGMLMTEYASSDTVSKASFLARNRIVAGMTEALIVAESAAKGGALVTARIAGAYGRDVFALPGRTSDQWSEGCNRLIARREAMLVDCAETFLDEMGWPRKVRADEQQALFADLTPDETVVLDALRKNPDRTIATLTAATGITHARMNATLLDLEFKGLVLRKPGGIYAPA